MDPPLFVYPLVAVAPLALHGSAMLGSLLLEPVRTGIPFFDRAYNRRPWLLSLLCGLCLVAALALRTFNPGVSKVFVAAAVTCFVLDAIAMTISFLGWLRMRR